MRVYDGAPRRDYEEILRTVGARLDGALLSEFVLVELEDGFYARGTSQPEMWGGLALPKTVRVLDNDLDAALDEAHARRGSGQLAGRVEARLRLVGRYVDSQQGSEILVVEQGSMTLLRMSLPDEAPRLIELGPEHIASWSTDASLERRIR